MKKNRILSALGLETNKIIKVTAFTLTALVAVPSFANFVCVDTYVIVEGGYTIYTPFCYNDGYGNGFGGTGYPGSGGDQSAEDDGYDGGYGFSCPVGYEWNDNYDGCLEI
jgi:hypothetical protein